MKFPPLNPEMESGGVARSEGWTDRMDANGSLSGPSFASRFEARCGVFGVGHQQLRTMRIFGIDNYPLDNTTSWDPHAKFNKLT